MSKEKNKKPSKTRLIEKIMENGFSSLDDGEKIQFFLLYGGIRDAEKVSQRIISLYGSFRTFCDADPYLLMKSAEVSETVATLVRLLPNVSKACMFYRKNITVLSDSESAKKYFSGFFIGCKEEKLVVTAVDGNLSIKNSEIVSSGDNRQLTIDYRKIIEFALKNDSQKIFISHNHPNGRCKASDEDIIATRSLAEILKTVDVEIADHIIVGNDGENSMLESHFKNFRELFCPDGYNFRKFGG